MNCQDTWLEWLHFLFVVGFAANFVLLESYDMPFLHAFLSLLLLFFGFTSSTNWFSFVPAEGCWSFNIQCKL